MHNWFVNELIIRLPYCKCDFNQEKNSLVNNSLAHFIQIDLSDLIEFKQNYSIFIPKNDPLSCLQATTGAWWCRKAPLNPELEAVLSLGLESMMMIKHLLCDSHPGFLPQISIRSTSGLVSMTGPLRVTSVGLMETRW